MSFFLSKYLTGKSAVTLTTVGIATGLIIVYFKKRQTRPKMWKSFGCDDVLLKYTIDHSLRLLPVQQRLMDETIKLPFGTMMGAPEIAQLLQNLLRSMEAKKVLEIGVFTGCTTLSMALGMDDDGRIIACDMSEEYINIARPYWKEANVDHKIIPKIQPALKTLDELIAAGEANTYDLAFIDADKGNYDNYYEKSLQLLRKGGIIAIDNVLWRGSVLEENPTRQGAAEIKLLNDKLKGDKRIGISMFTIGDGLTLAFKL